MHLKKLEVFAESEIKKNSWSEVDLKAPRDSLTKAFSQCPEHEARSLLLSLVGTGSVPTIPGTYLTTKIGVSR